MDYTIEFLEQEEKHKWEQYKKVKDISDLAQFEWVTSLRAVENMKAKTQMRNEILKELNQ